MKNKILISLLLIVVLLSLNPTEIDLSIDFSSANAFITIVLAVIVGGINATSIIIAMDKKRALSFFHRLISYLNIIAAMVFTTLLFKMSISGNDNDIFLMFILTSKSLLVINLVSFITLLLIKENWK